MNFKSILGLVAAACLSAQTGLLGQTAASPQLQTTNNLPSPIENALGQLVRQVQSKVRAGKSSEADLADEIKTLDALIAGENGAKTDEAARLVYMKGTLYLYIIKNTDKGMAIIKGIKTDYPDTSLGKNADRILDDIAHAAAAAKNPDKPDPGNLYARAAAVRKLQDSLVVGGVFPDFTATDLDGKPLSVASRKGKVLLLDFWATWNGPSRTEMPEVIATYKKHHAEGFEIIGVSLDADPDQMHSFLKEHDGMTWPQYYDGLGSSTKLAVKYGVDAIPFLVLIGPDGKIISKYLRGEDLEDAVAKAMAKK